MNTLCLPKPVSQLCLIFSALFLFNTACGQDQKPELQNGDRVVFLGSEFIEQQIKYNYLETELTLRWPDRQIDFINLGWAGDTPSAIARGYFGGAAEGFRRLLEELDRIKPTQIIVCYGANSEPAPFQTEFKNLFDELKKRCANITVLSHPAVEATRDGRIDPQPANQKRAKISEYLSDFVDSLRDPKIRFVDLFSLSRELFQSGNDKQNWLTHDSIRFTEAGYLEISNRLADEIFSGSRNGASAANFEKTRKEIFAKNQLFFHRYRPQNETYLRGFRKHEQGQNAKEINQFDALIAQAVARIQRAAQGKTLPPPPPLPDPIKLTFEAFTPEQERGSFTLADGLSVNLFAAEPMVANPIHMNFDNSGKLWVATSPIYPQIKPGAIPNDQIVVLEDTNGDGKADQKTIFADDLLIPTAVLPDEMGGAYVANSTEIIHLSDTNGDGKADHKRVVLSGFGTEDTHHIVHTFRWGPDAAIYFNQSIYIHSHLETPHGVQRLLGSGIWRFDPQTVTASVSMRGLVNPWGHIFDDWGQGFATDGASGWGINYAFPGIAYQSAVGFSQTLRGMNPGQPKHCGLEIITGPHFEDSWQNNLVTNDFRGNRINRFTVNPDGAAYTSKQLPDLMSSDHRAFRPVDLKMAPDGSLFIADWYNPIINHGEIDFRDSRRDYKHGRIWRVTQNDRQLVSSPNFAKATPLELIQFMKLPEQWNRFKARVELKNRILIAHTALFDDVAAPIENLMNSPNPKEQLEALWTLDALNQLSNRQIKYGLDAADYRVRAATLRMISNKSTPNAQCQAWVIAMLSDSHPQVQLEAINTWRRSCDPSTAEVLFKFFETEQDQYTKFLLTQALKDTQSHWLGKLQSNAIGNSPASLIDVLSVVNSDQAVGPLMRMLKTLPGQENEQKIIQLIGQRGNANQLKQLFEFALATPTLTNPTIVALLDASKKRKVRVRFAPEELKSLFKKHPATMNLAGAWKIQALQDELKLVALGSSETPNKLRLQAIKGLAAFGDTQTLEAIALDPNQPKELIAPTIKLLAGVNTQMAAKLTTQFMRQLSPKEIKQHYSIIEVFINRKNGVAELVKEFRDLDLNAESKQALVTLLNKSGQRAKPLSDAIGALRNRKIKMKFSEAELNALIKDVQQTGNASRGETVYRRDNLSCIKCHAIGGSGGIVGPDLISLGSSSPMDYIIESLVNPNAKIKEGYHTTTILTDDGRLFSGKLISQSDSQVTLRDAENKELVFSDEEIEEQKISNQSLMPTDAVATLDRVDFLDLVSFLSELGKEGPYRVSPESWVRRWVTSEDQTIYSRVDGSLPMADVKGNNVAFDFEVTQAGAVGIAVENGTGLRITLDGQKDNLQAAKIIKDLRPGKHSFHFQLNGKKNRESLRVRLLDLPNSKGKTRLIN
ncbi:MAG: HEAT repeat domain-containing protein [Mariniblastus sp.]|nr:HEAT repeat domain-containing protein [Mariniblastus sp.]